METPAMWNELRTKKECYICMTKLNGMISSKHVTYSNAISFTPPIYNYVIISGDSVDQNASVVLVMNDSKIDVSEDSTINESELDISEDAQESASNMDVDKNSEDLCSVDKDFESDEDYDILKERDVYNHETKQN